MLHCESCNETRTGDTCLWVFRLHWYVAILVKDYEEEEMFYLTTPSTHYIYDYTDIGNKVKEAHR